MRTEVVDDANAPEDRRNVVDKYRGMSVEDIRADLDTSRVELEIAVENIERDFNMGTIIRNANAFNVKAVHIIGRRQWNKRGAMKTDAYMNIQYHNTVDEFVSYSRNAQKQIIAIDIVPDSVPLASVQLPLESILVFGSEGSGLSDALLKAAAQVVNIEQLGSTRSVNVGVASGIAMYAWVQQYVLHK